MTDFGIAKALTAATGDGHGGLTSLGVVLGTPAYMAPEQGAGDPATDHRVDIYAFGCLAYEALTGAPPFAGRPPASLIAAHAIEAPEPLARRRPRRPAGAGRPGDALPGEARRRIGRRAPREVLQALDAVPPRAAASPGGERWRSSAWRSLAVIAGLAVRVLASAPALPRWTRERHGPLHSVAVLPFVNTGGDPEDEYFSDGMTDELAHALAGPARHPGGGAHLVLRL